MFLTVHVGCVNLERNKYVGWGDIILLGDADDNVILQQGRFIRAKRGVGCNDNASLLARSKDFCCEARPYKNMSLTGQSGFEGRDGRMTLDLVHSGNYYVGELEQVFEVSRRDIGDACR